MIRAKLDPSKQEVSQKCLTIVIATVKGDVHDIGKNIVKVLLENYGFAVIDLGKDVASETILETVKRENAELVGLSALMTTTVASMKETIDLLKREAPHCKIMVGRGCAQSGVCRSDRCGFLRERCHGFSPLCF